MKKIIITALAAIFCICVGYAKDFVIKSPGYFKEPIRDGQMLFPDSLVFSSDAEEINIPDMGMFGRLGDYGNFPNLKKITFGNIDYLPGGLLEICPVSRT